MVRIRLPGDCQASDRQITRPQWKFLSLDSSHLATNSSSSSSLTGVRTKRLALVSNPLWRRMKLRRESKPVSSRAGGSISVRNSCAAEKTRGVPNASRLAMRTTVILIPVTLSTNFFRRSAISLTSSSSARFSDSLRCFSSSLVDPVTFKGSEAGLADFSEGEEGAGVGGIGTLIGSVASRRDPALDLPPEPCVGDDRAAWSPENECSYNRAKWTNTLGKISECFRTQVGVMRPSG
jgi:hypothetical protein